MTPPASKLHFVLGMHRSGTSAVAGLLEGMGLTVGRTVMSPRADNPLGFFENAAIADFHDRLLEAMGSTWHDPRPLGQRLRSLAPGSLAQWRGELARILAEQFEPGSACVVKDPRLCRLLPLWEPIIAASGAPLVVVVRHPAAVAASLQARDGFSMEKGLMLWLVHNLEMERGSRAFAREFVCYDDLLRDPIATCSAMRERLKLPERDLAKLTAGRLRGSLRHHGDAWPEVAPRLRGWCERAFEILWRGAAEHDELDEIFRGYADKVGWLPDDFSGLGEVRLQRETLHAKASHGVHVQVFADQGAGYNERASIVVEAASGQTATVRFERLDLLRPAPSGRLRIDPANRSGLITLSRIRIVRAQDGEVVFNADTEEGFRRLECSRGLVPAYDDRGMILLATDCDPQLLLPCLGPLLEAACTLEMTLKVEVVDEKFVRELGVARDVRTALEKLQVAHEELGVEHRSLREESEVLALRVTALEAVVESACRWQRSWFRRAFHRWRPSAANDVPPQ